MHSCMMNIKKSAAMRDGMAEQWQIEYLKRVINETGKSLSGVAAEAGISSTTLTRPFKDPQNTYDIKLSTLEAVERVTGVPLPKGRASGTPARVEFGEQVSDTSALIPVYDVQASAGFGALVDYEEQTHSLAFPPDYLRKLTAGSPRDLVIISTKGDSMEPTLLDDDIVLVDTSKRHMGYEGMFVLRHNDTLLVKRAGMSAKAGHVMLISDNKAYPAVEAALADLTVIGKVLWYGRKV